MPLAPLLHAEIARRGPIPFRDFMERALYDPTHGYYASGRVAIGRNGDFFTSVSVGPLFGRLLARQFAELWERLGRPAPFTLVEQGAHGGEFARDALEGLREFAPEAFAAVRYVIVEPLPQLAARQRERLETLAPRIEWAAALRDLEPFVGAHFSNELPDAFPIHLVTFTGREWLERHVAVGDGGEFAFVDAPLSTPALRERLAALPEVPAGYVTEVNLAATQWIGEVADRLARGCLLAIDYGFARDEFYRPERIAGTLTARAAHRRETNPLTRPGELDLTAHVDFTSLAERALAAGLSLAGFTDQHHFFAGLSPLHFGDEAPITPARQKELRALQTLMHPALLGQAFKAICFTRGLAPGVPLAGFRHAGDSAKALGLSSDAPV